jgi:hypothetical protein
MWPAIISGAAGVAAASASKTRDPKEKRPIKTAVAIGIGALTAVVLYKIVGKEIKAAIQKKKNLKLFEKEKEPTVPLTYKPSQYITWADKIEDSMNANWLDFTDEEAIYSIMRRLKTNNDWLELMKSYGKRKYYDPTSPTYIFGKDINLLTALQLELDTKEKNKVNVILKNNGIKYRI